ncbi:hypothetical protein J1D01_03025 [Seonamhaeicola sp. NFXS20]|uniref:DUF6088 family protein n=1 Tax=Seonamhaeicola sp. NFXS20 TaxID=2816959 RepID=UPI003B8BA1F6
MTLTAQIRKKIEQFSDGKTFGYQDLCIDKRDFVSAAKAMERLQKEGLIKKISKGQFYKPQKTVFGDLKPNYTELLRPYLFQNNQRIAYETGTSLYNKLGLTTQIPFTIKIASRGKKINVNRENLKIRSVKSYAEITEDNYQILGLLDAFKDVKEIPDCSVAQAIKRLSVLLKKQSNTQIDNLIEYALLYPPRARALLGAILENNAYPIRKLEKLKNSLNPLTSIKLDIEEKELPTKKDWYIR